MISSERQSKVLCVVDPNLKDMLGHDYEYDAAIKDAAGRHGYEYLVLAHKDVQAIIAQAMPVKRAFSRTIWDVNQRLLRIPKVGRKLDKAAANIEVYLTLRKYLKAATPDWVVFGHMLTDKQLLGWAWWFHRLPVAKRPQLLLLLRYSVDFYTSTYARTALRLLEEDARWGKLRLCTDSERLTRDLSQLTTLPVETVPIPHTTNSTYNVASPQRNADQRCHFMSLGNARDEKGFNEILEAIKILHEAGELQRYEFVLQSNSPYNVVPSSIDAIKQLGLENVRFVDETLTTEEYYSLLQSADVVLLPYWHNIYASRTSGIFTEALAAGKPVIATDNCWMGEQVIAFKTGMLCKDKDPVDLARAIREVASQYSTYAEQALRAKDAWLAKHNPDALVEALIKPPAHSNKPTKIAIFYPWSDILEQKAGAARLMRGRIDYLSSQYKFIRVYSPAYSHAYRYGNVEYHFIWRSRPKAKIFRLLSKLFIRYTQLKAPEKLDDPRTLAQLWLYYDQALDPAFLRQVKRTVKWADVVLVDYPFWGATLAKACQQNKTKLIITSHDVMFSQAAATPWLRDKLMEHEIGALKLADHAASLNAADNKVFEQCGVQSTIINPGIDIEGYDISVSPISALQTLAADYGVTLPTGNLCLFVGSDHPPNIAAVEDIKRIAQHVKQHGAYGNIQFVVAGGCCKPGQADNFTALGPVEEHVLQLLYQASAIVLTPVLFGTGISLKTIEAMAYGKPIIGTTFALRGYAIVPGTHAIVSEEISDYPNLILNLLSDITTLEKLGKNARSLAASYDYHIVYQQYTRWIEE